LDRYPRSWEADLQLLRNEAVDLVFAPTTADIYPPSFSTRVEPPRVAATLEGDCRPGHFAGVATVVLKLMQILPAQRVFFGEKDFQQCLVVRDMVRDFNLNVELCFCPTVRDRDGLAMSSRNRYLTIDQRQQALIIPATLDRARQHALSSQLHPYALEEWVREQLQKGGIDRIDYVAVRDAERLEPLSQLDRPAVLLVAAHVGTTRLIDNVRLPAQIRQPA
jgi:pantoate--beta-alanine ligase